jgi:xanthine dehydrogenase accessory factor
MSDADDVVRIAGDWLGQGKRICIATVVRREGSAPRETGAKMVISADGKTAGTVGGGAVEQQVLAKAAEVIRDGKPLMMDFNLSGDAPDVDALCGGNISVFLEPLGATRRVTVIGAGHIGKAVARLACSVGFAVTLVDDREGHLRDETLPPAVQGLVAAPGESGAGLDLDESSFVVICTGGHTPDKDWLRQVLKIGPRYVGMLGSKHKAARIFDDLEKEGFRREALEQVHVPVGLDIRAETPEEIAVSIVGQLIMEWRKPDKV